MNPSDQIGAGTTGAQVQKPSLFEDIAARVEFNNQRLQGAIARLDNFLIAVEATTPTAENPPHDDPEAASHPRERIIEALDTQKAHVETLFELANHLKDIASVS